jgi:anti-sigma factor RsiW
MCPDRQIISVYVDNELPSPWKEKLESHAVQCRECGDQIGKYSSMRSLLAGLPDDPAVADSNAERVEPVLEAAKSRVWKNLVKDMAPPRRQPGEARKPWRLTMPVPAAVAALTAVALLAALAGGSMISSAQKDSGMATLKTDMQGVLPVVDMAGVLQYLETQETAADIVIIRLPESRNFVPSGEPALVRAADYMRSDAP